MKWYLSIAYLALMIFLVLAVGKLLLADQVNSINQYCSTQPQAVPICKSTLLDKEFPCNDCIKENSTCSDVIDINIIRYENCNLSIEYGRDNK